MSLLNPSDLSDSGWVRTGRTEPGLEFKIRPVAGSGELVSATSEHCVKQLSFPVQYNIILGELT